MATPEEPLEVDRRHGPGKVPPQVFEQMVANSQNLITEAQLLRKELERIDTDRRLFKVVMGIGALLLGAVLYMLVLLVQNAQQGQDTRQLLIECVVPPQERKPPVKVSNPLVDCYTRAQAQQGEAVGRIGDVTIRAACAAQFVGDLPAITGCVEDVSDYIKSQQP